jgi:hypothetical protein
MKRGCQPFSRYQLSLTPTEMVGQHGAGGAQLNAHGGRLLIGQQTGLT